MQISAQTKMTLQYSEMALSGNGWNIEAALKNFEQLKVCQYLNLLTGGVETDWFSRHRDSYLPTHFFLELSRGNLAVINRSCFSSPTPLVTWTRHSLFLFLNRTLSGREDNKKTQNGSFGRKYKMFFLFL